MASFIYFYAKFTEEFLLLSAAGVFTLLSIYCYTWVVKKRRLGAARNQVPAGMVKVYLNQLINEAQFVRTQLFGLVGGTALNGDHFAAHFQANPANENHSATHAHVPPVAGAPAEVPNDLWERLKALEAQLHEKESMVVNINVEKNKLLEEVENLKQNEKAMGSAATGNHTDLIQKIKSLEERLEEYALFEDDLANLKRLQQENTQLKKQLEQPTAPAGGRQSAAPAAETTLAPQAREAEPQVDYPTAAKDKSLLDEAAIEALLDGQAATPPTVEAKKSNADEAVTPSDSPEPTDISPAGLAAKAAKDKAAAEIEKEAAELEAITAKAAAEADAARPEAEAAENDASPEASAKREKLAASAPKARDQFENLVDSVENSLTAVPEDAKANLSAPTEAQKPNAEKTDEELLKEFENLLNS